MLALRPLTARTRSHSPCPPSPPLTPDPQCHAGQQGLEQDAGAGGCADGAGQSEGPPGEVRRAVAIVALQPWHLPAAPCPACLHFIDPACLPACCLPQGVPSGGAGGGARAERGRPRARQAGHCDQRRPEMNSPVLLRFCLQTTRPYGLLTAAPSNLSSLSLCNPACRHAQKWHRAAHAELRPSCRRSCAAAPSSVLKFCASSAALTATNHRPSSCLKPHSAQRERAGAPKRKRRAPTQTRALSASPPRGAAHCDQLLWQRPLAAIVRAPPARSPAAAAAAAPSPQTSNARHAARRPDPLVD